MEKQRFKCKLSIDSIKDEEWREAFDATADRITYLKGNPKQGPFSEKVLGIPAKDFFSLLAFDVLFTGKKKLKAEYTLKRQMRLVAEGLMSNHERLYQNFCPIIESMEEYREFLMSIPLEEEMDPLDEERYAKAEAVASDDPELLEFVRQLRRCETRDDIAEEMEISINKVYNLTRKLKRRLIDAGYIEI